MSSAVKGHQWTFVACKPSKPLSWEFAVSCQNLGNALLLVQATCWYAQALAFPCCHHQPQVCRPGLLGDVGRS